MGLLDNKNNTMRFNYSPQDVYAALLTAINGLSKYTISEQNDHVMYLEVKKGMTIRSYPEILQITVSPYAGGISEIDISAKSPVAVALFGPMAGMNAGRESISKIVNALSEELSKYSVVSQSSNDSAESDLAKQLEQLASLRDRGILTDEEFQAKKRQLLQI